MGDTAEAARSLLRGLVGEPAGVAEAPGRVNLIGEHTDYNGGRVCPAALDLRTAVAVRLRRAPGVGAISREEGPGEGSLDGPAGGSWLDYVLGVARELRAAGRLDAAGFDVAVASDVPTGAGLSSSAALEVASALALATAAGSPLRRDEALETARLCQRAESQFVGVPCGLLDPFASLLGREGEAVVLDCRTLRWRRAPLPLELVLLIVDTGVRRDLRSGGYARRREECGDALARAREALGLDLGSLGELRPEHLDGLEGSLPERLFRRLRHVVTENARVEGFVASLEEGSFASAGRILLDSHESLRRDFEVTCPESDRLAALAARDPDILGGRMTGAGWGGCTVHLVRAEGAEDARTRLSGAFAHRFGREPRSWIVRPGPGARVVD